MKFGIGMRRKLVPPPKAASLSRILAIAFVAVGVLTLVVASGFHITLTFQAQQLSIANQQRTIALGVSEKVSNAMERVLDTLQSVGSIGRPFSRTNSERWLSLRNALDLNENFIEIALVNGLGRELMKVSRLEVFEPSDLVDLSDQKLFEKLKNKKIYIGMVQIDETTDNPTIQVAVPITNIIGDLEGGLVTRVSLKFMQDLVTSLKPGGEGVAYIVDREGRLIAFHDVRRVQEGQYLSDLAKVMAFKENGKTILPSEASLETGIYGALSLTMYVPLGLPDWAVIVEMPFLEAYQPVILYLMLSMVGVAVVAALAIAAGLFIARRLAAPLHDLTEAASLVADGQFELEINETGSEEVRTLAAAFNTMTAQVRTVIYSLEEKIADNRRVRDQLESAKEDAERANKVKSEFLAAMSHELRTPLNAVLGFTQMLQIDERNPLAPAQYEHTQSIIQGGNHLLELVNEILDLAKIEADQHDLTLSEVDARVAIADCVKLISPVGKPRNLTFIDKFSNGSSFFLLTDLSRLKQILINLLSNAVKFNKTGGTVTVETKESDHGYLRISVSDTGVGIADESLSSVFNMFHRLGADSMVAREGTGIGLTVSKLLVERMAGRIGVESEEGLGCTFWVDLPLTTNDNIMIWTDAIKIGVDAIDKDHQVLISKLNRLMRRSFDDADVDMIIHELIEYFQYHFRRQEIIMKACAYSDIDKHCDLHRQLIADVIEYSESRNIDRDPESFDRFRKFLKGWLLNHILKYDKKIMFFAKGKNHIFQKELEAVNSTAIVDHGSSHIL